MQQDRVEKKLEKLHTAVRYWKRCLESEDTLSLELSPRARTKACKSPFLYDPFIFPQKELEKVNGAVDERLSRLIGRIKTTEKELYYGYPILFYNGKEEKDRIAPLFVTKLTIDYDTSPTKILLSVDEPLPDIGISAMNQLGLRSEEVAGFTRQVLDILLDIEANPKSRLAQVLSLFEVSANIPKAEEIDPTRLSSERGFSSKYRRALYNKAVFFEAENTAYNRALLEDLEELQKKDDLDVTSLSILTGTDNCDTPSEETDEIVDQPALCFETNEYQLSGIRNALRQKLTVVTGPPGTGKSQFISNLLLNLYVRNKKVLLVSHTNEAVEVVHRKISDTMGSLIMRTGNREKRQELEGSFRSLVSQVQDRSHSSRVSPDELCETWSTITRLREQLLELDHLYDRAERKIAAYRRAADDIAPANHIDPVIRNVCSHRDVLRTALRKFEKIHTLQAGEGHFFPILACRLFPSLCNRRLDRWLETLMNTVPDAFWSLPQVKNLQNPNESHELWIPYVKRLFSLADTYKEYEQIWQELESRSSKKWVEQEIQRLSGDYIRLSREHILSVVDKRVRSKKTGTGRILSFLDAVSRRRANEGPPVFTIDFMTMLPLWVSTLKSLRRTFSLQANIFDFVIFDEASQIDLPSAAPALYRARRAIIVGDPMQLTHITSLSSQTEQSLAKETGIHRYRDIYPSRIRYNSMSLYKAGEASLSNLPLLLAQHYRSHEEIIDLCNTVFYEGRLSVMTLHDYSLWPAGLETGLHWVDVQGVSIKHPVRSRYNIQEADAVLQLLDKLILRLDSSSFTIGVVTPFSRQRNMINDRVHSHFDEKTIEKLSLRVLTAHQFQGSEKDIMIFSPVVAEKGDGNDDRWFDFNPQILNVALSRARRLLYIVGDLKFCAGREGVLGKIHGQFIRIKRRRALSDQSSAGHFDTNYERILFSALQNHDGLTDSLQIVPKYVEGPFTLDIALVGERKIDLECDGSQHEIVDGIPVISDVRRDQYLKEKGWTVVRIPNYRIDADIDKVIEEIEDKALS